MKAIKDAEAPSAGSLRYESVAVNADHLMKVNDCLAKILNTFPGLEMPWTVITGQV